MSSSWADRNHNHSVLCQTRPCSTFGPIHLPHRRQNVSGRKSTWVPWPHPCWTVALLKIKALLLGITTLWHGPGGTQESSLDGRQLDQIDHHSSQAFKLKQSRCPLAQALNIFATMNSSDLSFFWCTRWTWLKAETFLDYCDENSRTLLLMIPSFNCTSDR